MSSTIRAIPINEAPPKEPTICCGLISKKNAQIHATLLSLGLFLSHVDFDSENRPIWLALLCASLLGALYLGCTIDDGFSWEHENPSLPPTTQIFPPPPRPLPLPPKPLKKRTSPPFLDQALEKITEVLAEGISISLKSEEHLRKKRVASLKKDCTSLLNIPLFQKPAAKFAWTTLQNRGSFKGLLLKSARVLAPKNKQ